MGLVLPEGSRVQVAVREPHCPVDDRQQSIRYPSNQETSIHSRVCGVPPPAWPKVRSSDIVIPPPFCARSGTELRATRLCKSFRRTRCVPGGQRSCSEPPPGRNQEISQCSSDEARPAGTLARTGCRLKTASPCHTRNHVDWMPIHEEKEEEEEDTHRRRRRRYPYNQETSIHSLVCGVAEGQM